MSIDRNWLMNISEQSLIDIINDLISSENLNIYKYRCGKDYDLDALREGKIWFSRASCMDDEYDCGFKLDIDLQDVQRRMVEKNPERYGNESFRKVFKEKGLVLQKDVLICCFGETYDNQDLWKRYGDDGKGFCIEYDVKDVCFNENVVNIILPVIYRETKIKKIQDFVDKSRIYNIFDIIFTKERNPWEVQQEWRMFQWAKNMGLKDCEHGCLVSMPTPKRIFLGNRVKQDLLNNLRNIVENRIQIVEYPWCNKDN